MACEQQHAPIQARPSGAYTFASVLDATDRFGLVAEEANLADVDVVADLRLPLIVFPIGAATEGNEAQAPVTPNLVLRAEGEQLRCLAAGAEPPQLPQLLSLPALKAAFSAAAFDIQTYRNAGARLDRSIHIRCLDIIGDALP